MRDSLDHAIDLSDFLIDAHGFVPIVSPITEPALGFGGTIVPVFLERPKYQLTDANGNQVFTPPNITAAAAGFTTNGSNFYGVTRVASTLKGKLRYKIMAGFGKVNIAYYPSENLLAGKSILLKMKPSPIFLEATYRIKQSPFYIGGSFMYIKNSISFDKGNIAVPLPPSLSNKYLDATNAGFGVTLQYDALNNSLTPSKGMRINTHINFLGKYVGGDFNYQRYNAFWMGLVPLSKSWVGGLRVLGQMVSGDAPFYYKPFIQLRGLPTMRYQGDKTIEIETEERWNFYKRWYAVAFAGTGKAFVNNAEAKNTNLVWNAGAGFRYLIARKFGLQMGVDVARGPEQFAYYIVFGYGWMKN